MYYSRGQTLSPPEEAPSHCVVPLLFTPDGDPNPSIVRCYMPYSTLPIEVPPATRTNLNLNPDPIRKMHPCRRGRFVARSSVVGQSNHLHSDVCGCESGLSGNGENDLNDDSVVEYVAATDGPTLPPFLPRL